MKLAVDPARATFKACRSFHCSGSLSCTGTKRKRGRGLGSFSHTKNAQIRKVALIKNSCDLKYSQTGNS